MAIAAVLLAWIILAAFISIFTENTDIALIIALVVIVGVFIYMTRPTNEEKEEKRKKEAERQQQELAIQQEKERVEARELAAKEKAASLDLSSVACETTDESWYLLMQARLSSDDILKLEEKDLLNIIRRCEGDIRCNGIVNYNYGRDGLVGILPHLYDVMPDVTHDLETNQGESAGLNSSTYDEENEIDDSAVDLADDLAVGMASVQDVLDHYGAGDVEELRYIVPDREKDLFDFDELENEDEEGTFLDTTIYKDVGTTSDVDEIAPEDRDAFWDDQEMEDEMIMGYGFYGDNDFFGGDDD